MITAQSRRCSACSNLLDDGDRACAKCGRVPCLPVAEWPDGAREFLCLLTLVNALDTKLEATEQQQLEWLLQKVVRGRWYQRTEGAQLVTYSAGPSECYQPFLALLDDWKRQGSPTDFAAIAAIRGRR